MNDITVDIGVEWQQHKLKYGYISLSDFRDLINEKVEAGELPIEYAQPRWYMVYSSCGGSESAVVLHPLQQAALDKINKK